MKLYIAIEKKPQKWIADDVIYKCHGTTLAYYDRKKLEDIINSNIGYEIVEVEVNNA